MNRFLANGWSKAPAEDQEPAESLAYKRMG